MARHTQTGVVITVFHASTGSGTPSRIDEGMQQSAAAARKRLNSDGLSSG